MGSVVVAGAGVAGLVCAWELQKAGHDVELLERGSAPGGRVRSERRGDFVLERGAQFVGSGYRHLHALARELGLSERLRPHAGRGDAILRDGRLRDAHFDAPQRLLGSKLLSPFARARLARLPLELARHWRRLDPLHPERTAPLERETLAAAGRRLLGREALDVWLAPAFSSTFDCEPEELSWAFALLMLRMFAGSRLASFEGGNGVLTGALAERLRVRLGCDVVGIETETDGARVRYRSRGREQTVFADAAVVALPGSEVARRCPKLTPAERGFFAGVRYGRGIVVHLALERAPLSLPWAGVAFPRREGLDLYGIAVDHHKPGVAPPGAGLLNAALCESAVRRMWDAPDAALADLVLENLAYTPIGRVEPVDFAVHRWPSLVPRFGVGYLTGLARFLDRMDRSPRLAFAGDYLVGPTVEGALVSGQRAAREIARGLRR